MKREGRFTRLPICADLQLVVSAATAARTSAVMASAAAPAPAVGTPTEVGALRTRFVNGQPAALQRLPIEASYGPLQVLAISQFDKPEASRLACHLIANDYG